MKACKALLPLLLIAALLTGCSYASVIEENWGLEIPGGYEEIYSTDTGASFQGDGTRYHVFCYAEGAALPDANWGEATGPTAFADSVLDAAEDFLAELDVPPEWRIPYADCRSAYERQDDNSELLLFLDEDTRTLYVVESFL
ncbi:MAG: hypothetical protein ACOX83_02880 [Candidatus Spyradocola sp.]|jgi:hypothetical protein